MKQLATKGDVKSARILAKEVVRSNKQKDRLSVSKARLGSINNQLVQQMGMWHLEFVESRDYSPHVGSDSKLWRRLPGRCRSQLKS